MLGSILLHWNVLGSILHACAYGMHAMHALMACMQCMQGRSAGTALWAFKRTERAQQLQVQPKVGA